MRVGKVWPPGDLSGEAMTQKSQDHQNLTDSPFSRGLVIAAVAIAGVAGVALVAIWWNLESTKQSSLAVEAGKTLMQVIGVVLLGAVLSYAANAISIRYQDGMALRQLLHTSAEAERVRAHSNWQREADQKKDERLRKDELRRALLEAAIANYNAVKRARRRLRAEGYRGPDAELGQFDAEAKKRAREVYVDAFERIIEAQLEFERLSKTADLAEVRVAVGALAPEPDDASVSEADGPGQNAETAGAGKNPGSPADATAHSDAEAYADDDGPAHAAGDAETAVAPSMKASTTSIGLRETFTLCAEYLAGVLNHYVVEVIPDPGPQAADDLGGFLAHREQGGFGRFSKNANAAMTALREELTKPLEVKPENDFTIDMNKVEAEWLQVLAKAPFSKQRGKGWRKHHRTRSAKQD